MLGWGMKTSTRLFLGFGVIIFMECLIIFVSYRNMNGLRDSQSYLNEIQGDLQKIQKLSDIFDENRVTLLALSLSKLPTEQEKLKQNFLQNEEQINDLFKKLKNETGEMADYNNKIDSLRELNDSRREVQKTQILPLLMSNQVEQALTILNNQEEQFSVVRTRIQEVINDIQKVSDETLSKSSVSVNHAIQLLVSVGIASFVITVLISIMLVRLFSKISDTINILGSSASEISAVTGQLATSATQIATAVSETTTTIEEIKQTAQVANQKAKNVADDAQKSKPVSDSGQKAANEIRDMITGIQNQMTLIAESMVRLNEQSQAIGSIIAAVDDLSQQSNLLSVNASIEAAKAGEQGKGFSVVAQEVKSLATQSKEATSQVRSILSDVQKATSAAVMATEQGSKSVEAGVKKCTEASEAILKLVNSVEGASQAATQISASSHQQLVGMEQAALAMENIKQASSQNVDSTSQLKTAAHNLKETGVKLQVLIGSRLNGPEV